MRDDRVMFFVVVIIIVATPLFVAHRKRWISNRTFTGLVGVATVIGMFAAMAVFFVPAALQPPVPSTDGEPKRETPIDIPGGDGATKPPSIPSYRTVPQKTPAKDAKQEPETELKKSTSNFVRFSKVMEPTFAEDYLNSDVSTEVQFIATGKGAWVSNAISQYEKRKYITFRVLPPGQAGQKNPLSNEVMANFVMIPRNVSDSVVSANAGDVLILRGRPFIETVGSFSSVIFIATDARKKGKT